jgi:hypothetical protein
MLFRVMGRSKRHTVLPATVLPATVLPQSFVSIQNNAFADRQPLVVGISLL